MQVGGSKIESINIELWKVNTVWFVRHGYFQKRGIVLLVFKTLKQNYQADKIEFLLGHDKRLDSIWVQFGWLGMPYSDF